MKKLTQPDTETQNQLIAFYMGAKKTGGSTYTNNNELATEYEVIVNDYGKVKFFDKHCWCNFHSLLYHKDWNWIIAVYQKIMKEYRGITVMEISNEENHILNQIKTHLSQTDIKNLHYWICEFIKWKNQNNK